MKETVYIIDNLGCANCAAKMEQKIRALPQVEDASITFSTRQLRIKSANPDALLPELNAIVSGIEPYARVVHRQQPRHHAPHCHCGHDHDHHEKKDSDGFFLLLGGGLFAIAIVLEVLSLTLAAKLAFVIAYGLLGYKILRTAAKNLVKGHVFDENFLMAIATIGAFFINEFPEAVGVMLFYRVGEYFEHRAVERSRSQIMQAVDLRPETVNLLSGATILAAQAKVGDILLVRPGDRIPLDSTVLSGESRIDTAPITGEPVPVRVCPGDEVISGCINSTGQLTIRVEKPLEQSMVTKILAFVEEAAAGKPKLDRFITRFARVYTPTVVLAAVATAIIPSLITGNWDYWVYTALSFLVMSCPCALVLSVPLAFFSGIGVGSRRGILFKSGAVMEAMAKIRAVTLDKTGTITKGDFAVQQVDGGEELLALCASCEQFSTHPIAMSIVTAAHALPLRTPKKLEEIPGHGIHAWLDGEEILCGNKKLMRKFGVDLSDFRPATAGTQVIVARNGRYAGYILISDTIKDNAAHAVRRLNAMGVETAMLTGDQLENARSVAHAVGIKEVHAQLLPHEKLERLETIREKHGSVMFVGDGINDAPVLSGADVGAAMGSGADAAIEAADVVFLTSQVSAIPEAISIARKTQTIAMQNVVVALVIKGIVMALGLTEHASMWAAVFADSGVALLCVLNSIRMLYQKH